MNSAIIQLLVLAGIALFLILRLKNVLGTRDGHEPSPDSRPLKNGKAHDFEVIVGGLDLDIADHVEADSHAGKALAAMKVVEPDYSVTEFLGGAKQAYEMILMAFENDDLTTLKQFLSRDVYDSFAGVVQNRQSKGLNVEATFVGVRETKIVDAMFDTANNEAEVTLKFFGELTSVVKNEDGDVVEGDPNAIKTQKDIWTFARIMGSDDPNWKLVATGE